MTMWVPRALQLADLPGLEAVQRACYGDAFIEDRDVFARRIASAANCSLALSHEGRLCAYLAAYRSVRAKVTPLNGDFQAIAQADTLYLHDMAVMPAHAGRGIAHVLLECMREMARAEGLHYSGLVSVQGSQTYWERKGYVVHAVTDEAQRAHLASYGDDAVYMLAEMG